MTTKKGIFIFIALFILFYILIYVVPTVSDIFQQTYIAKYGTLDVSCEAECVIVRDETVYTAPTAGSVDRKIKQGDLMRAGSLIATVGDRDICNEETGVVSYYYDGFEKKVTSDKMTSLTSDFFKTYKESSKVQDTVKRAEAGNPIFKIVDRSKWYIVFWVDKEEAQLFAVGNRVSVDFSEDKEIADAEDRIRMSVHNILAQGDETQIILSCNRNYDDFDKYRTKECKIITSSNNGLLINTDSIGEEEGIKGVYVLDKFGRANFTPIRIYSSYKNDTVIAKDFFYDSKGYSVSTVENYDEILKKPVHKIQEEKDNSKEEKAKGNAKDK